MLATGARLDAAASDDDVPAELITDVELIADAELCTTTALELELALAILGAALLAVPEPPEPPQDTKNPASKLINSMLIFMLHSYRFAEDAH